MGLTVKGACGVRIGVCGGLKALIDLSREVRVGGSGFNVWGLGSALRF